MLSDHSDDSEAYQKLIEVKDLDIELPTDGTPFDASILGLDTSKLQSDFEAATLRWNQASILWLTLKVQTKALL